MITPENAIPAEFAARLDVWRFRYQDRIDEFNDLYDPAGGKTPEWYSELYADMGDNRLPQFPSAVPTRKAA